MEDDKDDRFMALRRKALAAEAELQQLATVYRLAVAGVKDPETITAAEVRLLCEAVLRHVKPIISRGRERS